MRTRGDGQWKKYTYQDVNFSITLAGLLKFDDENFSGWEMLNNQLGFATLLCRISFEDDDDNIMTVQGEVMIETSTLGIAQGNLVKNDFQLQGNGSLIVFEGLVPCPTVVTAITVNGQEATDGTISVTYVYTGEAYQIMYRIDNTGDYVYALADETLTVPGLSVGQHSVEIIPVCVNGYQGTGMMQAFQVTKAQTCSSSVTGFTIHEPATGIITNQSTNITVTEDGTGPYLTVQMTGSASTFILSIDGSAYVSYPAGAQIPLSALGVGVYSFGAIPVCTFSNGDQVQGSGQDGYFQLNSQASQSALSYNYINDPIGNAMSIYINGVLAVNSSISNASGSLTAPVGATVRCVLSSTNTSARVGTLTVTDNTAGTQLYNNSANSPFSMSYSFVSNGHSFTITGIVSP